MHKFVTLYIAKERLQNDVASFKISPNEAKVELGNFVNQLNATKKKMRSINALKMAEVLSIRNRTQTRSVSQIESSPNFKYNLEYSIITK